MQSPNPRSLAFQSRRDVGQLVTISKNLYPDFTTFPLEESRLYKNLHFVDLVDQIRLFNEELDKWRKDTHDIKNIVLTYHLYENLFSRLKYISSLSKNQEESDAAIDKATQWFSVEKPKVRCRVPDVRASMRAISLDPGEDTKTDRMIQTNAIKRQMLAYEMMSRTAHPGLFPPKQQLKEYKRKQFIPYLQKEEDPFIHKSASASHVSRNKLSKYRMSTGTMITAASLKQSKTSFKNTASQFKYNMGSTGKKSLDKEPGCQFKQADRILEQENPQLLKQRQESLLQSQRQLKANQEEIIKDSLVPENNQEDEPDAENYLEEQQPSKINQKKLFVRDNDPMDIDYAKQLSKEPAQSSIRRGLKTNQQKIQSKLEDLDLKRNMLVWGKVKGKLHKDEERKIQSLMRCNQYQNLAFRRRAQSQKTLPRNTVVPNLTTAGFAQAGARGQSSLFEMPYRSKSSSKLALEGQIEKLKIKSALKVYGRYVNHVPRQSGDENNFRNQYQQVKMNHQMRSMSLTSINFTKKKQPFSQFLHNNDPNTYNQSLHEQIVRIKTSLSKKGTSIQNASIYKALSAIPITDVKTVTGFYTHGRDLMSNPFFPKTNAKKKKKKNK